jgi:hypothetical protein
MTVKCERYGICQIRHDKRSCTTHEKLIIVYGIQRSNVKNCFYEETNWRAMKPTGDKPKASATRQGAEDFNGLQADIGSYTSLVVFARLPIKSP